MTRTDPTNCNYKFTLGKTRASVPLPANEHLHNKWLNKLYPTLTQFQEIYNKRYPQSAAIYRGHTVNPSHCPCPIGLVRKCKLAGQHSFCCFCPLICRNILIGYNMHLKDKYLFPTLFSYNFYMTLLIWNTSVMVFSFVLFFFNFSNFHNWLLGSWNLITPPF